MPPLLVLPKLPEVPKLIVLGSVKKVIFVPAPAARLPFNVVHSSAVLRVPRYSMTYVSFVKLGQDNMAFED